MPLFPRYRGYDRYEDRRLTGIDRELGRELLPGRFSRRLHRKIDNQLGRRERDEITRALRRSEGDPMVETEALAEINRNTAGIAADASIDAELAESDRNQGIRGQRMQIALAREQAENERRAMNAQMDYQNSLQAYNAILDLLGGGVSLGAGIYENEEIRKLLRSLGGGI